MKHTIMIIVLAFLSLPAYAERTLVHEAVVDAPVATVWDAWTTDEGFTSWAVKKAQIDLRIGGDMRTSYNPQSNLNDEHTIINRIISYEPQRMLSIRNVQAPAGFKNADLFQDTWTVIYFQPIAPQQTHIRIVGMGYGEGPAWDDIYNKFKAGNQFTLDKLREKFQQPQSTASNTVDQILDSLRNLIGGQWVHESTSENGQVFRARNLYEAGPGEQCVIARSWLGNSESMFLHGATQIYLEPETNRSQTSVRFQSVNERGDIACGDIRLDAENQLIWDWRVAEANGKSSHYQIQMTLLDADHYKSKIERLLEGGEQEEVVNIVFVRVRSDLPH
jgi:uncharacterized protein YndB with AHSA1/START domain